MKHIGVFVALFFAQMAWSETIYFHHTKSAVKEFEAKFDGKIAKFNYAMHKIDVGDQVSIDGINFYEVKHDTFKFTSEVGEPQRIFNSEILIGKPGEFLVEVAEGKSQYINKALAPAKEWPCRCEKDKNKNFEPRFEKTAYRKSQQKFYELEYLGDFRGIPLTRLNLFPMKAWGQTGFEVFPEMQVTVKSSSMIKSVRDFSELYKLASNQDYLVIAPQAFKSALQPLLQRRASQGFNIKFVTKESAGETFDDINSFIHNYYQKNPFGYALLVGSEESFPTQYVPTSSDSQTPSDLRYFTMGGDKDDIPDVFYGRMVVANVTDVVNQVKKIMTFENRTYANEKGINSIIGIASNEGANPSDVEYVRKMQKPLVDHASKRSIEFLQENANSTSSSINKAFSNGSFWVNYIGHGSGDSWPSIFEGEYHVGDIKKISKGSVLPVIIDVACQNGRFSLNKRLGERFMNETAADGTPIGAVAYYGGSVDISWHPPALMAVAINEKMVSGENKELGKIVLAGQLELYRNYSDKQSARENLIWYHLFGDPALQIDLK